MSDRARPCVDDARLSLEPLVDRVRTLLEMLDKLPFFTVRGYGQHILIDTRRGERTRDRDSVARLTALGHDAFGLSFRKPSGGWEPIVLIDTLDEIVADMTTVLETEMQFDAA
jgi:hypothetical protein